jgi:imidazolonepropionase-like amidohydrolase
MIITPALAHAQVDAAAVPPQEVVAFLDVNVIPMDRERVLTAQTVIVRNGRIEAIGSTGATEVPAGARVVNARGKYLLPGLYDMHAHVVGGQGTLEDAAGQQLALLLAHGVTTARHMAGPPTALQLRERIRRGELLGPALVVYSSSLNGNSVPSAAAAPAIVKAQQDAGVDGLKLHGGFSAEVYDSIVAAADRAGLVIAGHVTPGYGLERAIAAGQQIEHLDGLLQALLPAEYSGPPLDQIVADAGVLAQIDTSRIPALARTMAERGIWNGPTLALFETLVNDSTAAQLLARPSMRYVPVNARTSWANQRPQMQSEMGSVEGREAFVRIRRAIVRGLHEAGAKLLLGSDSPQFFMVPGDAVHRELEAFVAAGVPAYGALQAATRNPAEFLRRTDEGMVATGYRADMVLLDANPLENISNIRRVAGVLVHGRWLDAARLQALKDAVAARHAG